MMRLSPTGQERIGQSDMFQKHAGGSELNVVNGIARLGLRTGLISKLPNSMIGRYVRNHIRSYGVSDDYVLEDTNPSARLGVYYFESGVYPRKPQVTYDRANSSFTTISPAEFSEDLFTKTRHFHTSGISLALGKRARETTLSLIKAFKDTQTLISFDVNYRANLWSESEAREVIETLFPYVDVLFVSEETSRRMLRKTGTLESIMKSYHEMYGISVVASTQRQIISPKHHTFGSMLYDARTDNYYQERPYENIEVVDRIGSGDAYVAGVMYALLTDHSPLQAVSFGNAMAAVKNTVPGDLLATEASEIEGIIADHHSTGTISEMNR